MRNGKSGSRETTNRLRFLVAWFPHSIKQRQHRRRLRISRKKAQKAQKKNRLCFVPSTPFRGNKNQ
jgi:hypothetical protein